MKQAKQKKFKGNLLPVRVIGDETLRKKAAEIDDINDELLQFIADLSLTMYETDGVGLAAPQVGKSIRVFVIDPYFHETGKKKPIAFINPVIKEAYGDQSGDEGCLSLPEIFEKVTRSERVIIEYTDVMGERKTMDAEGYIAVVIQHEYDHLDGILFIDRVAKLRLIPWKRKIKELERKTDSNGINIRKTNQ